MKYSAALVLGLQGASAFPTIFSDVAADPAVNEIVPRAKNPLKGPAFAVSEKETNCGPTPCLNFNEKEQFVSIAGQHAYISPSPGDIRGPCPGLNAAANHNYISRSGVLTQVETVQGLGAAFGMSVDLAEFLAAYAIVMDGDLITMTWSIGGPQAFHDLGGLLTPPQGISYSHNKYEGDVSIGRNDAYLNNGDAHSLNINRFKKAYASGQPEDRYTLHKFRADFLDNVEWSVKNNPYYFSPPFAGAAVAPAAYNFVINLMSNHSEEVPNGYLDGEQFKTFFAVKGDKPSEFKWMPGQERIPPNWYRRSPLNPYTIDSAIADVAIGAGTYPTGFRIGGNVNGKDSYTGVDVAQLTGGTFKSDELLKGNNLACLIFLSMQQGIPDELKGGVNSIVPATTLLQKVIGPQLLKLSCPKLAKYDSSLFNKFPGRHYSPTGLATNY